MIQNGLFDLHIRFDRPDNKKGDPLSKLNQVIDWELFRPALESVFEKERKSNAGAKGFDKVMLFKCLILQSLYNLSDEALEFQILDRLSFPRSRTRARIEHVFGVQTQKAGNLLLRTIGIIRARAKIGLRNLAYNLDRYRVLVVVAA